MLLLQSSGRASHVYGWRCRQTDKINVQHSEQRAPDREHNQRIIIQVDPSIVIQVNKIIPDAEGIQQLPCLQLHLQQA